MKTVWKERRPVLDQQGLAQANQIARECELSDAVSKIVVKRGYTDDMAVMGYLEPSPEDFFDPFLLPDMEAAVKRLMKARQHNEKICIYGDYDVDGTTAVSMLMHYFKTLDMDCIFKIPNRIEEGYGMNIPALKGLIDQGVDLIVTVDNGIAAKEEITYCCSRNVDVIVTDHHECQNDLPEACAVVDAKRPDAHYPFAELCGAGIALKMIQAMEMTLNHQQSLQDYLERAALATVADIVPLKSENRLIVSLGLESMKAGPVNPGIEALKKVSEIDDITAGRIGFIMAPKINAAGRLGEADRVISLYNGTEAADLNQTAQFLKEENEKRQDIEKTITDEAIEKIKSDQLYQQVFIVASGEGWHSGVIGIVASKIQELWHHPVIVIGIDADGLAKGSCRSVEGINIFEALSTCSDLFESFGGHEQAAGFSIRQEKIDGLIQRLQQWGVEHKAARYLVKTLYYDSLLTPDHCDWALMDGLSMCEPYGVGNPGPVFKFENVTPQNIRKMGKTGDHLSFTVGDKRCVAFGWGDKIEAMAQGTFDILATPQINSFRNEDHIELRLVDMKSDVLSDNNQCWQWIQTVKKEQKPTLLDLDIWTRKEEALIPGRSEQIYVYHYLQMKQHQGNGVVFDELNQSNKSLNSFKLIVCLELMEEIGIIKFCLKRGTIIYQLCKTNEKKDIQSAPLMIKLRKYI